MIERLGLAALRQFDPERAHGIALSALNAGLGPRGGPLTSERLQTTVAGLPLPNPIGLAAGFDKNATALPALGRSAFGFLEVGAATPRPQPGNPRPRLFRLTEDQAAINRFGFNNDGAEVIASRLRDRPKGTIVGLNLGANKDSTDRAGDFASVLATCGAHVDFATVNVSSPNTEKLRDLQGAEALSALLHGVLSARDALPRPIPVFLKIAPDLTEAELEQVVEAAQGVDAIIATNTTLGREGLASRHRSEAGGLSGQPLFEHSTRVLARLSTLTDVPLVGVGGVATAEQAYAKIRAGASAVQLYTSLVYGGLSLVREIAIGLDRALARDGFTTVSEAVGSGRADWL
ncbi:dihydroorotate dehydrogenase (quinone) [Jannaschia pagri]|uniref:Dihydroorotate dehydrogenase (quinone) n=1 Tax=Jannaschia pagri TaxID=2829797 RepID=A0ABQ4NNV3_9RHOB|nr:MULTISPECIES: quinone-dependent dihydroorotate dehydrogenase [unclassified Jannaschia]GIT92264.1 dihydroorotate dehydrogenase (quinone) [Jannaschia sp. AI_61]GIT96098.1 dihydroorotate dehydrogenase (quinone) [Jannaschia sp. AI_62]